jgi:hypothetical protein
MAISKVYTLSDGSKWTALAIAKQAGLSITSVRCRLCRTADRDKIFAPALDGASRKGHFKVYVLSDGSEWTVPEIAEKTGMTRAGIGARLAKSLDVDRVMAKAKKGMPEDAEKIRKSMADRMCHNDRDFWKTFNANT